MPTAVPDGVLGGDTDDFKGAEQHGCCLVFPLAAGGSLSDIVAEHGPLKITEVGNRCCVALAAGTLLRAHRRNVDRSCNVVFTPVLAWLTSTDTDWSTGDWAQLRASSSVH